MSGWKTESTRKNQIRFYRNVINNETNLGKDGLIIIKVYCFIKNRIRQLHNVIGEVMKLGVCIPYRDTGDGVRKNHLDTLVPHLEKFLGKEILISLVTLDTKLTMKSFIGVEQKI